MRKKIGIKSKIGNIFLLFAIVLLIIFALTEIKWVFYSMVVVSCVAIVFKWIGNWEDYSELKRKFGK